MKEGEIEELVILKMERLYRCFYIVFIIFLYVPGESKKKYYHLSQKKFPLLKIHNTKTTTWI